MIKSELFEHLEGKLLNFPLTLEIASKQDGEFYMHELQDENSEVVGIILFERYGYKAHILSFEIDIDKRNRGLGKQMMQDFQYYYAEIMLSALPSAIGFYKKLGFVPAKENGYYVWRNYVSNKQS